MRGDKKRRNSLKYKIKMWFRCLTLRDIKRYIDIGLSLLFEILIGILGFILIFIIPALFH